MNSQRSHNQFVSRWSQDSYSGISESKAIMLNFPHKYSTSQELFLPGWKSMDEDHLLDFQRVTSLADGRNLEPTCPVSHRALSFHLISML